MLNEESLKQLIKNYYPDGTSGQIDNLLADLLREMEVMTHAKIRELVNQEKMRILALHKRNE